MRWRSHAFLVPVSYASVSFLDANTHPFTVYLYLNVNQNILLALRNQMIKVSKVSRGFLLEIISYLWTGRKIQGLACFFCFKQQRRSLCITFTTKVKIQPPLTRKLCKIYNKFGFLIIFVCIFKTWL